MYGVAVDIRPESIGGCFFESNSGKTLPRAIYSIRISRKPQRQKPTDASPHQLKESLGELCGKLSAEGQQTFRKHAPDGTVANVYVTVAAPYAHTISRPISFEKKTVFEVTKAMMTALTQEAERKMTKELKEADVAGEMGLVATSRMLLESKINGYAVPHPVGLRGTTLEFTHVSDFILSELAAEIERVQDRMYPHAHAEIGASLSTFYCVFRDIYPETESCWIIDITGESTQIGIVECGTLECAYAVPWGSDTLLRHIGTKLKMPYDDVATQLRALEEKTLAPAERNRLTPHMTAYGDALQDAVKQLSKKYHAPLTVIFAGAPLDYRELLASQVHEAVMGHEGDSAPEVKLAQKDIKKIAEGTEDIALAAAIRFIHNRRKL